MLQFDRFEDGQLDHWLSIVDCRNFEHYIAWQPLDIVHSGARDCHPIADWHSQGKSIYPQKWRHFVLTIFATLRFISTESSQMDDANGCVLHFRITRVSFVHCHHRAGVLFHFLG